MRKTKAAYRALMNNTDSEYMNLVEEHKQFLRKHGRHADERLRKRWPREIERTGIECALWPAVFYDVELCFTWE
eukprot:8682959-Karenia_brevis.AAC.1